MTAAVDAPPLLAFEVEVARIEELTPVFRRITFAGDCLSRFSRGPEVHQREVHQRGAHQRDRSNLDLRIKLMIPSNGNPLPRFDTLAKGWYQQWLAMDPEVRGHMRTYSVRNTRVDGPEAEHNGPEIDVDFVIHLDADGHGGPASNWAAGAEVGDRLTIIGPNESADTYGGIEWSPPAMELGQAAGYVDELHPRSRRVLFAGDETAVPAISSILEALPPGYTGNAYLEVPTAADFMDVATASDVEITWIARNDRQHGEALSAAVRGGRGLLSAAGMHHRGEEPEDVDIDSTILWDTPALAGEPGGEAEQDTAAGESENFYAWIAGEAGTVKELRRYLVRDLGVDRRRVAFMGYWRRGRSEGGA
ncbi:siderophore-interacting protein [Arthrobacter castelli]|uniref:siderophore-interacting protein n=1 Tax=Arthrobacter castelli TaxID=271431 RepID=UPI00040AE00A|nr:siderophore-interacting protein [Arthrobacter castelli]